MSVKALLPGVISEIEQKYPDLTPEQCEAVATLIWTTALPTAMAIRGTPEPFGSVMAINLIAGSLAPFYMQHGLFNPDAVVEFNRKVETGEVKFEVPKEHEAKLGFAPWSDIGQVSES